jgi:hypothetical protein
MFDEKGIPVAKRFGEEGYEARVGKVQCETSLGCVKGHWKDKPDLNTEQRGVIRLFRSCQATSGRCLTKAESKDYFLTWVFAELYEVAIQAQGNQTSRAIENLVSVMMVR